MASPDPSLPPDDELRAAEAAMRGEWAEIRGEVMRLLEETEEEDRPEAAPRVTELMAGFLRRHRKVFAAVGTNAARFDPAFLEGNLQRWLEAAEKYVQAEDALLAATADLAEGDLAN